MIIGSISENLDLEQRVAVTPDLVKKYKSLGLEVYLCKDYATHLGISDKKFETEGANIKTIDEIMSNSDAILQMSLVSDDNFEILKTIYTDKYFYKIIFHEIKLNEVGTLTELLEEVRT